ncbi:MAG: hypothetical protein QW115_03695 [Thermoplasmata archaeon]
MAEFSGKIMITMAGIFVPEPPVPYIVNYTPPLYNLHDLYSTKA